MDGVEGRPDALALAQAIEKLNRKGAQVATFQRSLAVAESGNDGVCVLLEVFVAATGIHEGAGGKVMTAGIVAAKFTVRGFPASQWLRRGGNPGVDAEGVQQTVRRQGVQVLTVSLHRDLAGTLSQTHLLHRKGDRFPGNFLVADGLARFLRRVHHRILWRTCHQRPR